MPVKHEKVISSKIFMLEKLVTYYRGITSTEIISIYIYISINNLLAMFAYTSTYLRQHEYSITLLAIAVHQISKSVFCFPKRF